MTCHFLRKSDQCVHIRHGARMQNRFDETDLHCAGYMRKNEFVIIVGDSENLDKFPREDEMNTLFRCFTG